MFQAFQSDAELSGLFISTHGDEAARFHDVGKRDHAVIKIKGLLEFKDFPEYGVQSRRTHLDVDGTSFESRSCNFMVT
jgi:hypothetical protein